MVVQHNLTAMNSNRMLGITTSSQAKSTEKLSSGYKINRAADDAAGLSISEKMRKQIRGLTQASTNAQDGISAVQTAEGALNEVQDMLQRMNELAVKAANGTNSEDDRSYIQNEIDQLTTEIDRVSETTKFNETYLLKGDSNVPKEYTYKYKTATSGNAATATFAAAAANTPSVTATFASGASTSDQNTIAKALRDQGISITTTTTWTDVESGDANEGVVDAGDTFAYKNSLSLNGSVADSYAVTVDSSNANRFYIKNKSGETVATLEVTNMTTAASKSTYEANDSHSVTNTISATTVKAGTKSGDALKYYDSDGNGIPANALNKYFTTSAGETSARTDAGKVYDALGDEITLNKDDVTATADLTGSLKLKLHVGADATANNQISVNLSAMSAKGLGVNGLKVDGKDDTNALNAIETIKESIQKVSTQRSALGAVQNRLEHTISNLDNVVENTTSAESAIRDTDMASEMVKYSNNNILAQAGQSMLAQANQSNQGVLSLLG